MPKNDLTRWPELPGMRQARDAAKAEKRKPDEGDRPPVSTFPMTPAARAAIRLRRNENRAG